MYNTPTVVIGLDSLRGIRCDTLFSRRDPRPFWWDLGTTLRLAMRAAP